MISGGLTSSLKSQTAVKVTDHEIERSFSSRALVNKNIVTSTIRRYNREFDIVILHKNWTFSKNILSLC